MKSASLSRLPSVFLNVAITADGKLAPSNRKFVPFSSKRDQDFLMELRTEADAVMSGATTVSVPGVTLGVGGPKYSRMRIRKGRSIEHLRVVVSGSGKISPHLDFFKAPGLRPIVLTTERISKDQQSRLAKVAEVKTF